MNMCAAMHPFTQVLYTLGSIYPLLVVDPPYQDRLYPLSKTYSQLLEESGYFHIQATKPDTVGKFCTPPLKILSCLSWCSIYVFKGKHSWILFSINNKKTNVAGVALRDSPVGLAAYILEKFAVWTNKEYKYLNDGGIEQKYSLTDLLDNVMIYWVTDSITTSMRLYSESFSSSQLNMGMDK